MLIGLYNFPFVANKVKNIPCASMNLENKTEDKNRFRIIRERKTVRKGTGKCKT